MQADQEEIRSGYRWFTGAGIFAVALSVVLWCADESLSTSQSEQRHYQEMHELRRAQTHLPTLNGDRLLDQRLLSSSGVSSNSGTSQAGQGHAEATH